MKILRLSLALLLPALAVRADPAGRTEDLGQGLAYYQPAAAEPAVAAFAQAWAQGAVVLDLRGAAPGSPTAQAWLEALRHPPVGQPICLVLISPVTPAGLLAALNPGPPGCLTLGAATATFHPDIEVATPPELDRQASTALAAGAPVASLLDPAPAKRRYDEALLARDRNAPVEDPATPELKPGESADKPADPPPLVDAVLQRAVQIHRGLLALRLKPARG